MLERERRPGAGCQSRSPVQAGALRARADLPTVRPGVGETLTVCAYLHGGQRGVLVSFQLKLCTFCSSVSLVCFCYGNLHPDNTDSVCWLLGESQ